MSSTTQFLRRLILFLLILNCLYPVLVLGQDETTPTPDPPEPTTREAPQPTTREPPEPTTREPEPTTREPEPSTREPTPTSRDNPPTTRPEPSPEPTPSPSPEPTQTILDTSVPGPNPTVEPSGPSPPSISSIPISTPTLSISGSISISESITYPTTVAPPTATPSGCALGCLATAAGSVGCGNTGNRACLCTRFQAYLREAESCMQDRSCPSEESSSAISQQQGVCASGPNPPGPPDTDTSTPGGPSSTPPNPPPGPTRTTTPPSPGPTVGTGGGNGVNGQLTTQTQTLALTPGQIVTLGVSGTVRTTYTASTGLTTTRIATMLEQARPSGNGGDGASGNGAMGLHVGCGMSVVAAIVGVMVGALLVF